MATAAGPGPSPPAGFVPGDWLTFGNTAEPTSLNCGRPGERSARQICRLTNDTLIDFDQGFHFVPRLAEAFEVSPDALTITFRLRQGVRWHDGRPFGARDVLSTVDAMRRLDPDGLSYREYFGPMAEVTAPDESTIRAVYAEPFSGALAGWREVFIMPAHVPNDASGPSSLDRAPLGTGPFRFLRWEPQQQIVLEANQEYFAGRPLVDRFIFRIIPNAEALRAAAEAGQVDVATLTPDWVAAHPSPDPRLPFRILMYPAFNIEVIIWNLAEPRGLFTDVRVRRALTMLLDRQGYAAKVQRGIWRPATTLIDPGLWGGDPSLQPIPYDPAGAARLLDEAGVRDLDGDGLRDTPAGPMSFSLIYVTTAPELREIASLLERSAAQAGIRVHLQGLAWPVLRTRLREHQFEAAVHRWRLEPLPDPYAYFHSSQISSGKNHGAYRDPEFDRLAEEFRRALDPDRASRILSELQRILHRDQPCTFVAVPRSVVAVHKRFRIPEVTASGLMDWYPSVLRWWVAPDERVRR